LKFKLKLVSNILIPALQQIGVPYSTIRTGNKVYGFTVRLYAVAKGKGVNWFCPKHVNCTCTLY